ncbi:MAG: GAF domain-containing protein, partial [Acidobacteriota bacterium]
MALFKSFKTVLVLLLSAMFVALGVQNLGDRLGFRLFYDGAVWFEGESGLEVERVQEPIFRSSEGIVLEPGDRLVSINQIEVRNRQEYEEVAKYLESQPEGQRVELLVRKAASGEEAILAGGNQLRTLVQGIDAVLALTALAFLLVGSFIHLRNWRASGAFHFYLICLTGFIVLLFRHSGRGDAFDQAIYWLDTLAWLLLPALLLHFSCCFPRTLPLLQDMPSLAILIYLPAAGLFGSHALWFYGLLQPWIDLPASAESLLLLDRIHLAYLAAFFLLSAIALFRVQRSLASVAERSQLKWITQGVLWGTLPFALSYVLPVALGFDAGGLQQLSVLSLAFVPLGFGYAITRYRLMDVDVIFKQGLAYALSSSALLGLYVVVAALLGRAVQSVWPGSGFGVFALAALFMAFLFSPLKERIQSQLDRRFYKDQYNYRASFSEFGQTLASEIQLPELNQRISERIQAALDVSTAAVFLRDESDADLYHCIQAGSPDGGAEAAALRLPRELLAATGPIQLSLSRSESERQTQDADSFLERGIEYIQPLCVRGRAIGFLGMGRRRDGEPLSSEDLQLVSTLAGYA